MASERSADNVIAALYSAAVDPKGWNTALEALRHLADARAANCFVHDAVTESFLEYRFVGYSTQWADDYAKHYHSLDLARGVLLRQPAGTMYPMHRYVPDSVVARSEYYQDFYLPEGLRYSCGGTLFDGNRRLILAVHRPVGHRPYEQHTVRELQRVLHHLPHVFRVKDMAMRGHDSATLSSAALAALPRGVVIVDAGMGIHYANPAAEALLNQSTGLRVSANRLGCTVPALASLLVRRVRAACDAMPQVDPVPLYMTDESGRASIEMHVVPLQPHLAADVMPAQPMAMVLLRCPFYRTEWPRSAHRPYGLTHAEMAALAAMIEGLTPGEHAERSGIRISTVRSQIKAILAKTGCRRIAEVVALFAAVDVPHPDQSAA